MSIFGCMNDEQFYDELYDEITQMDYDIHYCETHFSYYCPFVNECNPQKNNYPAKEQCRDWLKLKGLI